METQGRGVLDTEVLAREVVIGARAAERRTDAGALVAQAREGERLRRERYGARSRECAGELGEDRQVGVQPDPIQPANAKGSQRPIVF
jgi:hypothetical protein